jgi:hypothetical protein
MAAAIIRPQFAQCPARDRLAAAPNVSIFDRAPGLNKDGCIAFVLSGRRQYEVRSSGDKHSALFYVRDDLWAPLAENVTQNTAFAAIAKHVAAVADVSDWHSPEVEATECAAAAKILATFTAPAPVPTTARERLAAMRGVSIVDGPLPTKPKIAAMVMAGIRCIDVHAEAGVFSAQWHIRFDEWFTLVEGVTEDDAFAAIELFVAKVAGIPGWYSVENDADERTAAEEVLAAFTAPASIPLAA